MSSTSTACPYVGLQSDPSLRYSYASESHRCYALPEGAEHAPDVDFQMRFCLTAEHSQCPRFQARERGLLALPEEAPEPAAPQGPLRRLPPLWLAAGLAALLLLALGGWQLSRLLRTPASPAPTAPVQTAPTPAGSPAWPTPPPMQTQDVPIAATPLPPAGQPTPTPTLAADEVRLMLTPAANTVGWVGSNEGRGNHFGDSFLHAGIFQGEIVHSAMQFDLSRVPRGAPIRSVSLVLTGLDDSRLNPNASAIWEVRWLSPEINEDWPRRSFQDIHNARVFQSLVPAIEQSQLAPFAVQELQFNAEQRALLERALVDGQTLIAFRIDGPQAGADNLFTWDSGYGPATKENGPKLIIVTGPPPPTPPPVPTQDYIVVTSTPTPENVLTAAAMAQTATAFATLYGTPQPTPRSMVTATPTPANLETVQAERLLAGLPPVIVPTPTPANVATATAIAVYATAQALTTGTWTPIPTNAVTATPTRPPIVITNTPTAANAATLVARYIAELTRVAAGPPTPLPPGAATPTPTATPVPEPANQATAEYRIALATIEALAGLLPYATAAPPTATPTATPLPTVASADAIAPRMRNTIVFRSTRDGGQPKLFKAKGDCVAQAEGCQQVEPLTTADMPSYLAAVSRRGLSPDGQVRLIVDRDLYGRPQIYVVDQAEGTLRRLLDVNGATFDPAWSPDGQRIAFVSDMDGNDELYVVNRDGSGLQRLTFNTWEWDRHPAWSPDGSQILFYSNRTAGRRQLWIMNADGGSLRNVTNSEYNDWDPLWIW